jgi:serine phosphatase RsbU (regulator of sigma subunit)
MTVDLGGFTSSYYAGLNLVIIGVNLLLPWKAVHSTANSIIIIFLYLFLNIVSNHQYETHFLINNLFFLCSTAVIAVSINHVKYKLVKKEFSLLVELKKARDAIWSEMELAKRIQTALLPDKEKIKGYEIAATMIPAKEVGGDYYDIIETPNGDKWVAMGDVSGHGVDSGLIMMMAQTSIISMVNNNLGCTPSKVIESVNAVIRENISRLGSDHYMTMTAIRFNGTRMTFAGKHQDMIIYRASLNRTELIPTKGTWIGIADDIGRHIEDRSVGINDNDIILLFTDGITEATSANGKMYGQERLESALNQYADLPLGKLRDKIIEDVQAFQEEQLDDMTLVVIKKLPLNQLDWS